MNLDIIMNPSFKRFRNIIILTLGVLLAACGGNESVQTGTSAPIGTSVPTETSTPEPISGPTSFISADVGGATNLASGNDMVLSGTTTTAALTASETTTRTVQEGDIYRVLENGKYILNLNSARGLQVIDISNADNPRIVGRAAMSGAPVEMYVVGERAYVLLNNWHEYRRIIKDGKEALDHFSGAGVLTVDISSRSAPKIVGTTRIAGYIQVSRLTTGGGKSALYVAVSNGLTNVHSFSINAQGTLDSKSSLALNGYVQAIQASGDRLMVARTDASWYQSLITVIDISSADGSMVQGADVQISGQVQKKNNMHIQGDIMRIVSGNSWWTPTTSNTNHVESFNIADIAHPIAVDHDTFGAGQQLFGTTFLADKAFFVTYLRQDPFHAFSILPDGTMTEESEFIVSGWNDFFEPVQTDTRLIGIGHNDENNRRTLAVSLYDISNLKNTNPLLARAEIDLSHSWSEASWDDRAYSVLENAANATADDGTTPETGLVLLPFTGWNNNSGEYQSGVQIFTFSANTLTQRGIMKQATPVRRSFMGDSANNIAANLSNNEMSLFNIQNTNQPAAKGNLLLAPSYSQFVLFKNAGVRYRTANYGWWGTNNTVPRTETLEIVSLNDADSSSFLGSISVPANSKIYNVAEKLAVVSTEFGSSGQLTTITTYDISDPARPRHLGKLSSGDIHSSNYFYLGITVSLYPVTNYTPEARAVGNALVFVNQVGQSSPMPSNKSSATMSTTGSCRIQPINETSTTTTELCSAPIYWSSSRYWSSYTLQVVDFSDPEHLALLPKINMPSDEEAVGLMQSGSTLWLNYKKPLVETSVTQPQSRYFIKALDLSAAGTPKIGKEINVPGRLMAITGATIYTFDANWNDTTLESSINTLILKNELAYLQTSHVFVAGQNPTGLLVDEKRVFVSLLDNASYKYTMPIFEVANKQFALQSSLDLESYPVLKAVRQGKVLVQVIGGFLLYDVSQPTAAFAQAYFPGSWTADFSVLGDDIYIPAYDYGIYQFSFDTANLDQP